MGSVVAQDNVLFSTTLRENVTYGLPRERREAITDAEIEEACRRANAWQFINDFPRKLETYAGERGVKLSGGQKQRLAIARAIIRKPTIVLLDEATSALDSKAEGVVQAALDRMIEANRTGCTIMIAHRLATVKECDKIIVMDKGHKVEEGSHEELLRIPIEKASSGRMISGWYHDLWNTQMGNSNGQSDCGSCEKARAKFLEARVQKLEAELRRQYRRQSGESATSHLPNAGHITSLPPPPPLKYIKAWSSADKVSNTAPPLPTLHRTLTECAHMCKPESPSCRR